MIAIDAGSRWVKIIAGTTGSWDRIGRIDTARFYRDYCTVDRTGSEARMRVSRTSLGLPADVPMMVTGYGRTSEALAEATHVNEIVAHVAGAVCMTGESDFTLLDIGGQDTKVASVVGGQLADFESNDRCAASCGRFIENISAMLDLSFDEISCHFETPESFSSTCAVFAETEVIERLAHGVSPEHIAAGINLSVFKRIEPMLRRLGGDKIVFSGGVARGAALPRIIEEALGVQVVTVGDPEFIGALGCLALSRKD